jgi:SOUL heme-binding protein
MSVEKAAYQVLIQEGPFELRHYEPMVVVTSRESDLSGGNGFNQLFNYISGNNHGSKNISMTAPVIDSLEGQQSTTSFVMPKDFQLQDVPLPNDPALTSREIKARQVAVIRFPGTINSQTINDKKTELEEWLKQKEMKPIGAMELARYNAPYVPPFARRNEIIVEVTTAL